MTEMQYTILSNNCIEYVFKKQDTFTTVFDCLIVLFFLYQMTKIITVQ